MNRIYLDYAASAPLSPEVAEIVAKFGRSPIWGNPSSLHTEGRKVRDLLDRVHTTVGAAFGVDATEVVLTSGATESNVLALRGVLGAWRRDRKTRPHVILSAMEHPSWYQTARDVSADITVVPASPDGVVASEAILSALRPDTALIGCVYVNNEIGTIQPVDEIGRGLESPRRAGKGYPVFHVDATQAFPYCNTHIGHTRADLMTISGHKYGALGGVGALIVKKATPLSPWLRGGSQEWGYRAGTENVLGALTLAQVVEWHDAHRDDLTAHVRQLQGRLDAALITALPKVSVLGRPSARSPHITYLWLTEVVDEHIVAKLDLRGFAVSSGSACSSGARLPSATLLALGYDVNAAFGGARVSYGRFTTEAELNQLVAALADILGPS